MVYLPLNLALPCSFKHIEADHGVVVHDHGVVALNEAHASHVGRQVEDMVSALTHFLAVLKDTQVDEVKLVAENLLLR